MEATDNKYNWFDVPEVATPWLIDGLIPADGYSAIVGKPKAGKSTFIRNLIVSVVKGTKFLGRSIDLPEGTGKVLYVHLDRKDKPDKVSAQLRRLGLTREEAPRLVMRLAEHLPSEQNEGYEARLKWLQREVEATRPHLIVIDLLWQFVVSENSNDYNKVLGSINALQDALNKIKFKGALIVTIHGRKATNLTDRSDDVLGSTGQRGSFSTLIMLTQNKLEQLRTIISDQTDIDPLWGEIPETVILQNPDDTLSLGQPIAELVKAEKQSKREYDLQRLILFVESHPGVEMEKILEGLSMSKKYALDLLRLGSEFVSRSGGGRRGDPHRFYPKGYVIAPKSETEVANAVIQ